MIAQVPAELADASSDALLDAFTRLTHMVHATDSDDLRAQRAMVRDAILARMGER